jgi:Mn-dependent DtxR family transcriptional regulator
MPMPTPSQEDYLEAIWVLVQAKGYARVTDLAERLGISTASVSKMVRRLHASGLLTYERYRGFGFTPAGQEKGRRLYERHRTLEDFLTALGVHPPDRVYRLVEGMEHHFDASALKRVEALVTYIHEHPEWWRAFTDKACRGSWETGAAPETSGGQPPQDLN